MSHRFSLLSLAGAAGAVGYIVGDVLLQSGVKTPPGHPLYARDDVSGDMAVFATRPSQHLRAGALAGVLSTPLYVLGSWDVMKGINGPGPLRRMPLIAGALLLSAHSLASFIHGAFYHVGEAYKRADEADLRGDGEEVVKPLVSRANEAGTAIAIPYGVYAALTVAGSVVAAREIGVGRSAFPKWAAVAVPPLFPIIAATIVTQAAPVRKENVRNALHGSAVSLGILASFIASATLPRGES